VDEADGIQEAFEGTLRVAVTAAGQIGEHLARLREQRLEVARGRSEHEGRQYAARLQAERAAARAQLTPVYRAEWWDRASAEDIGRAYTTARAWNGVDPEAHRAEQRIRDEVRTRYGIDVDQAGADPVAVRDYLARAEAMRQQADQERNAAGDEYLEVQLLATEAERADRAAEVAREAAEHESDPAERERAQGEAAGQDDLGDLARAEGRGTYDSAERREAFASDLERAGVDHESVATRVRADVSQGKPATDATRTTATKAPRARKGRAGRGQRVQRTGLDR
jgi:hypothetical protein